MNNTPTSSVRANKLIPELRFPEFENDGEWEEKNLGNVFTTFSGGTPNTSEKAYYGGDIPFIRSAEINKDNTELFINEKGLNNSSAKLVNKGDLLIALYGANSGDVAISKIDGAINQAILCLKSSCSNTFTYHFLSLQKSWIVSKYIQGGQGNLSGDIVKSIKLPLPKPYEQQKIAACLSSLDEVITAESNKLEALKDHKKGLMQNLFPQEGETVPKWRFKEFVDNGEWVEKKLDSLTTKISDGLHTTPNYDDKGEFYFINGNNLIDGKICIDEKTKRVSEEEYNRHKKDLNKSTILLSINGTIGNIAVYKNEKVILGKSACYINLNTVRVDKTFIFYFIQTDCLKSYFNSELTGSTIKNLSLKSIKETIIKVPIKQIEQQKIASCLSTLDEIITSQAEKIEQLKLHKKGLMQGLFPSITKINYEL